MPRVSGKCLKTAEKDGKVAAWIQMNGRVPKVGDLVSVKWGKGRSNSQNAFLWLYYDWLLQADESLKTDYTDSEGLHETMKATFLSRKITSKSGKTLLSIGSTTTLNKDEFGQFLDKVKMAMNEYYGIDDSEFWREYQENYSQI